MWTGLLMGCEWVIQLYHRDRECPRNVNEHNELATSPCEPNLLVTCPHWNPVPPSQSSHWHVPVVLTYQFQSKLMSSSLIQSIHWHVPVVFNSLTSSSPSRCPVPLACPAAAQGQPEKGTGAFSHHLWQGQHLSVCYTPVYLMKLMLHSCILGFQRLFGEGVGRWGEGGRSHFLIGQATLS